MKKICNVHDIVEADRIICILQENGINAISNEAASGVVAHQVSGFGLYGVDIMVRDEDMEKAADILANVM